MSIRETRIALKNVDRIDPIRMDEPATARGYEALRDIVQLPRGAVIDELIKSSLRGKGGAGFSAGLKERFTTDAAPEDGRTFLVCNADEGEPGTFKDRIIMEKDPHLVIQGMLIAAYAIGASKAYLYIRGEYRKSIEMMKAALAAAEAGGFLGTDVCGTGLTIDIEIKLGAGSYLCGEELTLLESMEGKRGYPRIKPPFPAEKGFFGYPTLVNNVETLATIPTIMEKGSDYYMSLGTSEAPGTKIFTLSGDLEKPGYCEVEFGVTIRELIDHFGGGVIDGKPLQAVLLGGAAGTFVDQSVLDTPTGYNSFREIGAVIGSGAVIVLSEESSLPGMVRSILRFFSHESCGKCVPCRVGTVMLERTMDDVFSGRLAAGTALHRMVEEADYMAKTSLCPLGQSPILPLRSLERYFSGTFGSGL